MQKWFRYIPGMSGGHGGGKLSKIKSNQHLSEAERQRLKSKGYRFKTLGQVTF